MIRILIENVFFFLLPTLIYIGWIAFTRNDWPGLGAVLRDAPLIYLFIIGATAMLLALLVFSTHEINRPGEAYVPPSFEGGKLNPGHSVPANK